MAVGIAAAFAPAVPAAVGACAASEQCQNTASNPASVLDAAQKLTTVSPDALNSTAAQGLVRTITNASTHNAGSDYTLLGSFPEYLDIAKTEGMRYFDMDKQTWDTLAKAGSDYFTKINMQFVDDGIAAGNRFVVTMGEGKLPGSGLQAEIQRLIDSGYTLVDGIYIPPQK